MKTSVILITILCAFLLIGCATEVINSDNATAQSNESAEDNISISDHASTQVENQEATSKVSVPDDKIIDQDITADENTTSEDNEQDNIQINSSAKEENEVIVPDWAFTGNNPQNQEKCLANAGQNEKCQGPADVPCLDKPILNLNDKTLILKLQNKLGYDMKLKDALWFIEDSPRECMTENFVESTTVSVAGSGFVDITTEPQVPDGQSFELRIKLSTLTNGYLDQSFDLNYVDPSSSNIDYSFANFRIIGVGR